MNHLILPNRNMTLELQTPSNSSFLITKEKKSALKLCLATFYKLFQVKSRIKYKKKDVNVEYSNMKSDVYRLLKNNDTEMLELHYPDFTHATCKNCVMSSVAQKGLG